MKKISSSNWYKKAFRGNTPRMNDIDEALKDPYDHKDFGDSRGIDLNTPGDQSTTGFGADYYKSKQPPKNTQQIEDRAIQPTYHSDYDGNDPEQTGDHKPQMESSNALFDTDSPIGSRAIEMLNRPDRDNTAVGPHNMSNNYRKLFDNISRQIS